MESNKVTKFKRNRFRMNIGLVVFIVVFLYIIISLFISSSKQRIAVAMVEKGYIVDNAYYSGVIIRTEEVVSSAQTGYVNYYKLSGKKIAKNDSAYIIQSSGSDVSSSADAGQPLTYSTADYNDIKSIISTYQSGASDSNYSNLYSLKYNLQNKLSDMISSNIINDPSGISAGNYTSYASDRSGIIAYIYDGDEGMNTENFSESVFDRSAYRRHQLTGNAYIKEGDPVYRLVTDNDWSIIINLSNDEAAALADKKYVTIRLRRDNLETNATINIFYKDNQAYAELKLARYMIRYINDRFIDIEIITSSAKGFKIPTSAIVTKDFYKVNNSYIFHDESDGNDYVIYKGGTGENGGEKKRIDIYYSDEFVSYVSQDQLTEGDRIGYPAGGYDDFVIGTIGSLEGVYNVNRGYTVFRLIEPLYKTDSYTIIKSGTGYGLNLYDRIVLNGNKVKENQIIN